MTQTSEDQRSDQERFYDEVIAPALDPIVQQCEAAGMSILTLVEFKPNNFGRMSSEQRSAGFAFQIARLAVDVKGDVDRFIAILLKNAEIHGHKSKFLRQLGVPKNPLDRSVH